MVLNGNLNFLLFAEVVLFPRIHLILVYVKVGHLEENKKQAITFMLPMYLELWLEFPDKKST